MVDLKRNPIQIIHKMKSKCIKIKKKSINGLSSRSDRDKIKIDKFKVKFEEITHNSEEWKRDTKYEKRG